jgi:uncharacterized phage protein (TIGR02220 family)
VPNRILREGILTSERIAKLAWPAEVFYRRLMSVVDDFGRYHAHPTLLRAACYPLQLEKVSDSDIGKWILATEEAGLVRVYPAEDGKRYLELMDFRQQMRAKASKYPQPPPLVGQTHSTCAADEQQLPASAHLGGGGGGGEVEDERKTLSGKPDVAPLRDRAKGVLEFLNTKANRAYQPVEANLELILARLKEGATDVQLRQVVAKKCREWGTDEKMAEYLRPATLFNRTKFAQYVGELVSARPEMS